MLRSPLDEVQCRGRNRDRRAIVHHFLWHERFTWAGRVHVTWRQSMRRLLRFNFTTGAVSILGNVALTKLLVDAAHLNYLMANAITIPAGSVVNLVVSDRLVFGELDQ